MQEEVPVTFDEPGKQRGTGKVDTASVRGSLHVGAGRGDALAGDQHLPASVHADAVEDPVGHEQQRCLIRAHCGREFGARRGDDRAQQRQQQ